MITPDTCYLPLTECIGLVSCCVDPGHALPTALETASVLLQKSPFGLRMTPEVFTRNVGAPNLEAAIYLENRSQSLAVATAGFRAAIDAFQERQSATTDGTQAMPG